jgi:predicted Fe-Mo cluster-binding NifX family protein
MARAAFATWNDRIAPVFDAARRIHLVDAESGRVLTEASEALEDDSPVRKARRLAELHVDLLVCGAISRPLRAMIVAGGIEVIPFVAGDLREVVQAWVTGEIGGGFFTMPGCGGQGPRRHRGPPDGEREETRMRNGERNQRGSRAGRGPGRGGVMGPRQEGPGLGRRGGFLSAGPGGFCLCPQCGHREAHARGIPCTQRTCSRCGALMSRE